LRHRRYLDAPAVAVLHIEGDLIDGENVEIPFLGVRMSGAKTLAESIRELRQDQRVRAVVLRIDSPGGSALASDIVWNEVMALRESKPVIASLGSVAASGGYYIASAADEIYAEPTTLTGSIGIFYGKADVSGLLDKVGIDVATFKRGAHADMESWARPYTPEERQRLMEAIGEYYKLFKERIVEGRGRGFDTKIVEKLARGRIWSGTDARYHLLVDELGGYTQALARARELGRVSPETKIFHVPERKRGLLVRLAGQLRALVSDGPSPMEMLLSTPEARRTMAAALPFAFADPGAPRARLPYSLIQE
ncbi:MAG: signal peptide peptidase SppA, partial [Deltaproteobacteria bacterium]|nr:signal peptide peptidase SppA [Deltaproteobacteria bacterium]